MPNSVTRWLAYFSTFGHLFNNENLPNAIQNLSKSVQEFPK